MGGRHRLLSAGATASPPVAPGLPEWGPWLDRIDAWVGQAPEQAEQASARMKAAIAVARDYVRQTGDGIRVSPAALNKKKLPEA